MALLWGRRPLRELPNDEENPVNEKPTPPFHLKRLSKSSASVFEIADDGRTMDCREFLCHPNEPWTPIGPMWQYEARKLS